MKTEAKFQPTLEFAKSLDQADGLAEFREQFHFPRDAKGQQEIYLVGNSLGLQPIRTRRYIEEELDAWQNRGVRGHFQGEHPWMPYHEFLAAPMASLVGAKEQEVVVMNSLTTNLHLMMASFFQPDSKRNKILIEEHAFPSDHYAIESQIRFHGLDPAESMVLAKPRNGEALLRGEDILELIATNADELALVLLPGVQYYTGQFLDLEAISLLCNQRGIRVGFDLAHAAGNVPLSLHDWEVDFAVWCSYKYLNSGPGSVGGCFVHEKHFGNSQLPRLCGWWGHDKSTRFLMENKFVPIPTAEAWQLSNPPILSLAAIRASLDVFTEAGGIKKLREKSKQLTGYMESLLKHELADFVDVITPSQPNQRGCQLSLEVRLEGRSGKQIHETLEAKSIATDWREPNVIRVAPVPLYNRFEDAFHFVETLKVLLTS